MGRDNSDNFSFIRIMNFNNEASALVNKAIKISGDEKCGDVNTVCLFLAILERTQFGKNVLEKMQTTYDMVYGSFQNLAESGKYGVFDSSDVPFDPKFFSREMIQLIGTCAQKAYMMGKNATVDMLIHDLLEMDSQVLSQFFDYIDFDPDEISDVQSNEFVIPEELAGFVEDINSCEAVKKETIKNVDKYVDDIVEVLCRKKKANPCLIGEAGVGKTTVVYRLAQRINSGNVPDKIKGVHIAYINGATLTAGTRYRGDFEERMKCLIDWAVEQKVILFLDEIHTFINSGETGHNDGGTAGNMIKKNLSDGSIHIIGATTIKEFHKSIEQDKAFNRRIQEILIKEPNVEEAIDMIKMTIGDYEKFHSVKVGEKEIKLAVELSDRYMKDSFLPDKAYTIIDQACTKAELSNRKNVSEDDVLSVVSKITKIDVNKLSGESKKELIKLEDTIGKGLIGQKEAVKTVCKAIRRAKSGIRQENKPIASFLFVGPTGVGKTELCKILSKEVAMGDNPLIKIDMSEFTEKNSISRLLGTTAGYIGYGEGGQLTEKVKHNPNSIVLFDEIEKAHPEVFNTFLQLLDEGRLTDGEGTTVDFTNCIIVMTSNAGYGADGMKKRSLGFGGSSDDNKVDTREQEKIAKTALEETFKPEFLNRIDNIVIFEKLTKDECKDIVKLMLKDVAIRLSKKDINVSFDESVISEVVERGYSDKYGARNLRREIQDTIEDTLSDAILSDTITPGDEVVVIYKDEVVVINPVRKKLASKKKAGTDEAEDKGTKSTRKSMKKTKED